VQGGTTPSHAVSVGVAVALPLNDNALGNSIARSMGLDPQDIDVGPPDLIYFVEDSAPQVGVRSMRSGSLCAAAPKSVADEPAVGVIADGGEGEQERLIEREEFGPRDLLAKAR
jgi:hypothetical protein